VVAGAARELLNKTENEASGVLSTAMSFLGLYRDPTVAAVTGRCEWRIEDLISAEHPMSLYLVVPPSDISRTKPLIRLLLNQIGRRLTESLTAGGERVNRRSVLFMLDEFPALGRLDFFESALAFMAGYGLRAFLIAQSLNQIEKAYGEHHSILDNCHVRVAFATNDERTGKRISDALGTATELRAQRNYAGHRLSPWLGHLMVSRQETARPLLTPGEVMQLPPDEEIVMVSGHPPVRAKKLKYFEDHNFASRVFTPPSLDRALGESYPDRPTAREDDWTHFSLPSTPASTTPSPSVSPGAAEEKGGPRLEPELDEPRTVARPHEPESLSFLDDEDDAVENAETIIAHGNFQRAARIAALAPEDGIPL
jgi:type IV secretion system protein VirD4